MEVYPLLHSPDVHTAKAVPGQSQGPRIPSDSHKWVAGTQVLGLFISAFPGALAGSWIGSREAGTWNRTPAWATGIRSCSFTCHITVSTRHMKFKSFSSLKPCLPTFLLLFLPSLKNMICFSIFLFPAFLVLISWKSKSLKLISNYLPSL